MKYFYVYIFVVIAIIATFIYIVGEYFNSKNVINDILQSEIKKRQDIVREIELLKSEKKDLDLSIENIKKYVDKKEQGLLVNIQAIKNKGNVQVRNVTDSSYISLLKELQPN